MCADLFSKALDEYKENIGIIKFEVNGVTDNPIGNDEERTYLADSIREAIRMLMKETGVTSKSKMQLIFNNRLKTRITQWLGLGCHGKPRIWGIEFKYSTIDNIPDGKILLKE